MGVKSLWSLLTPVGRPVLLETVEGKTMAIDSSIWIYQFQATMRDKDGRALSNAHVLGFLRRITKLLFYGIKPVFVFDGGAPALKKRTLTERKQKRSGAADSHAKIAEKLLAAQLRREAVEQTMTQQSKDKGKAPAGPALLTEDTVYLEDVDPSLRASSSRQAPKAPNSTPSPKKTRFHDHDPYRLPEVDFEKVVANATRSSAPDPRLATEDELRAFIEEIRPEDFDVNSPEFRELPTEIQYEIVGDLRLKSRQTSYKRLQNMLRNAPTALDFSRQQIVNLKKRNDLTQQLLTTTDNIGKAHISIPVRIASERNREYILIKNESAAGGWTLGITDDGTQAKPIEIDQDSPADAEESDGDVEMEEVAIPAQTTPDPDLRLYQQEMALSAIQRRHSLRGTGVSTAKPAPSKSKATPLFMPDDGDISSIDESDEDGGGLALALQASFDEQRALSAEDPGPSGSAPHASTSSHIGFQGLTDDDEDLYVSPTRLETALAIANAGPSPRKPLPTSYASSTPSRWPPFGQPAASTTPKHTALSVSPPPSDHALDSDDLDVLDRPVSDHVANVPPMPMISSLLGYPQLELTGSRVQTQDSISEGTQGSTVPNQRWQAASEPTVNDSAPVGGLARTETSNYHTPELLSSDQSLEPLPPSVDHLTPSRHHHPVASAIPDEIGSPEHSRAVSSSPTPPSSQPRLPDVDLQSDHPVVAEDWDPAHEMDPRVEEGEFVRFLSSVKGRDIADVRKEIDDEIATLRRQNKAAMRDAEDVTQQMVNQIMIMLRLFGIPYITAPMEAEAQCAELVQIGLVDGIITDDSDVFLFGGLRVFKNMFNQSKTVECFMVSDLERELGLTRDTLIRLAYLLGSDYVEGLPGIGPVLAMELLQEFPGEDGLHKFKEWWLRVQIGKDKAEESKSKFKRRFKRQFQNLYLSAEWPNPAVRDAYYHPTVDSSEEPFKWGLPDLDGLRMFLHAELGWNQGKVDDLLLPIIQRIGRRSQAATTNKQGTLNDFFDVTAGTGTYAPRKRQAYTSKRLQQVVSDFRRKQANIQDEASVSTAEKQRSDDEGEKRGGKRTRTTGKAQRRGRGRSIRQDRGKTVTKQRSKRGDDEDDYEQEDDESTRESIPRPRVELRPRARRPEIDEGAK